MADSFLQETKPTEGQLEALATRIDTTSYGITFEELQKLVRDARGDTDLLAVWLREFYESGGLTAQQIFNIWTYVDQANVTAQTVGLPAGASFNQIYGKVQATGVQISPADRAFLEQGLGMERGLAEATAILKEPKEELTRIEKFQRASRARGRFIEEHIGPGDFPVSEEELAAIETTGPADEALKIRALQADKLVQAAADRPEGFSEAPREEQEKPFEPFVPQGFEGISGAPSWQRWFENKYAGIVRKFQEREPTERTEEAFGTFLGQQTEKEREQWWRQGAFQRGERPSAFAPRIRTVNFG